MIPRSSQRWRGLIGTGWLVVAGVAAGGADAAEGTATIAAWQVPHVTLPVTVPRRVPRVIALVEAQADPDPLRGTPDIRPETTGENAAAALAAILPERSDSPTDWFAPVEPLHYACEPRALPPCVPPPPCHPSEPPDPYDLVGLAGWPTCGPIYRGPCEPRAARDHHGAFAWYRQLHDRFVDHFYRWK